MRYILLVVLNLPIVLLALLNVITQYKLKKISGNRFRFQFIAWIFILIILIGSFPLYNHLTGKPLLDSSGFSAFDLAEITVIVYLMYGANNQRRKIEQNEKLFRELHQELSIRLSEEEKNGNG